MPIYMDRHEVSGGVTAESVAQMHQADLKIQDRFGCKGLTYWFDGNRQIAFCLIDAPDSAAIQRMHQHAHGQVPNKIVEVDVGIVESFLGRIQDPEKKANEPFPIIEDSAFRIIMVITLKEMISPKEGKKRRTDLFEKLNIGITAILHQYLGSIVKRSVGYYLISFTDALHALQAAIHIQSQFEELRKDAHSIRIKIGLSAGNPVTDGTSVFEETIKLAERMCAMAQEEIIVSSQVSGLLGSPTTADLNQKKKSLFLTKEKETFITQFMHYMESSWNNVNLGVADFCKPVHCSKSQLYRKMMALTGHSFLTFIKDYRLNEAVKLLTKKEGNISDVAFETGFSSPSYFSKCFHKKYGCMPSQLISLPSSKSP